MSDLGETLNMEASAVRMPREQLALARAAAQLRGISFSEYVRVLINQDIKQGDAQ